jgi:hypothetical protein
MKYHTLNAKVASKLIVKKPLKTAKKKKMKGIKMHFNIISQTATTAEVVLVDRDNKTSFTRHLVLKNGRWFDRFGAVYTM